MAKCRLCKKNIPDGSEYCTDCLDKKPVITDESYLDGLLNSVKTNNEPVNINYKKTGGLQNNEPVKMNKPIKAADLDQLDPDDLADFDQFDIHADIEDPIIIGDEELFGQMYDESEAFMENDQSLEEPVNPQTPIGFEAETDVDNEISAAQPAEQTIAIQDFADTIAEENINHGTDTVDNKINNVIDDKANERIDDSIDIRQPDSEDNVDQDFLDQYMNRDDADTEGAEEAFDPSIGDLLRGFELTDSGEDEGNGMTDEELMLLNGSTDPEELDIEGQEDKSSNEEDFLSLLNQFSADDPVTADVQAITELLSGTGNKDQDANMPSDVGEVFSDALKAVSGLEDLELDHMLQGVDISDKSKDKKKSDKKESNKKKKGSDKKASDKKPKTVKGKGLFGKLFGNVVDEAAIKAAKKDAASGEAAAAKAAKKPKLKKSKKGKGAAEAIQEVDDKPGRDRAAAEKQPENEKAKKKEKVKKPKKEKKHVIEMIDDYDDVEGRINKLGATIVFAFFGVMVVLLLIGTSLFTYSISIKNATTYFDRQKYTEAYNEVYGMELKDEDIELYEKIMTVMFVNKQLNSYNNYYAMKKYPEALDSLLKGLKRYDKYIELATILGIKSDLDYVRDHIMAELEQVYRLSEEDAMAILECESQKDYSVAVYDVVLENMKY